MSKRQSNLLACWSIPNKRSADDTRTAETEMRECEQRDESIEQQPEPEFLNRSEVVHRLVNEELMII